MNIITERMVIRCVENHDVDDFFDIYSRQDVCKYLLNDAWTKENYQLKFQQKLENNNLESNNKINLACVYDNRAIGNISVTKTDMRDTFEIGYAFHPDYAHKGYAKEAVSAVLAYLFKHCSAHRVFANMDARNNASKHLCENVGMRLEAHFIKDYWSKGEWTDSYIFAIIKDEINL